MVVAAKARWQDTWPPDSESAGSWADALSSSLLLSLGPAVAAACQAWPAVHYRTHSCPALVCRPAAVQVPLGAGPRTAYRLARHGEPLDRPAAALDLMARIAPLARTDVTRALSAVE